VSTFILYIEIVVIITVTIITITIPSSYLNT